ncbi:protocatechuate 3,4-dioxygenase subunit alpha [uncultured Fibrella sp.]|uniref:protocatechuate 3,4-dioxygenase subunit alpha n=1 Tax=uncultured Fibrella sp. TaxID=1284596 RepID=UPI0035CC217D
MDRLRQTPSQTVGPFFAYSLTAMQYGYAYDSIANHTLIGPDTPGERISVTGRILDGQGAPVPDAIVEIWQADATGTYRTEPISIANHASHEFIGFGRVGTGTQPGAVFRFETIKPGSANPDVAPHINIILLMRGSLRALYTRLYFSDEAANKYDALLNSVSSDRRTTLIASAVPSVGGTTYHLDIHLQGEQETVFFDL